MSQELAERVREQLQNAFKDRISAALVEAADADVAWVCGLYAEMRTKLCGLVPNRTDLHAEIEASFDVEFLRQRLRHRAMDARAFQDVATAAFAKLRQFQAPDRDAATQRNLQEILSDAETDLPKAVGRFVFDFNQELDRTAESIRAFREMVRGQQPQRA